MYNIKAIVLLAALASACHASNPSTVQPYGQCLFLPLPRQKHFDADFSTIQAAAKTSMVAQLVLQAGPASILTRGTHSAFPHPRPRLRRRPRLLQLQHPQLA